MSNKQLEVGLLLGLLYLMSVSSMDHICSEIRPIEGLDRLRLQGSWALVVSNNFEQPCSFYHFKHLKNDTFIYLRGHQPEPWDGDNLELNRGHISETGHGNMNGFNFDIVATDYETYLILYGCEETLFEDDYKITEKILLLMRQLPNNETQAEILDALEEYNLYTDDLLEVDQSSNCDAVLENLGIFFNSCPKQTRTQIDMP